MIESILERQVFNYLTERGCLVHKVSSELYPGFPDRIVIHKDFAFYIELKTPDGRLSKAQKLVHERIREKGIWVFVVRRIEDIPNFWGDSK